MKRILTPARWNNLRNNGATVTDTVRLTATNRPALLSTGIESTIPIPFGQPGFRPLGVLAVGRVWTGPNVRWTISARRY